MGLFDREPEKDLDKGADEAAEKGSEKGSGSIGDTGSADDAGAAGTADVPGAPGIDADLFDEIDVPDAPESTETPDIPGLSDIPQAPHTDLIPDSPQDGGPTEAAPAAAVDGAPAAPAADTADVPADVPTAAASDAASDSPADEALEDTEDAVGTPAPKQDVYDRAGRARPQRIEPRRPEPEAPAPPAEEPVSEAASDPASDDSATTVFAAAPDPAFAAEPTESTVHTGHTDPASGSAADAPASPWDQGTVSRGPVPESSEWMTDGDAAVDADQATAVIDPAAETTTFVAGQPGAAGTAGAGAAATQMDGATPEDGVTDEAQAEAAAAADVAEDPRRGTLDFGLLILRLVVGGLLIIRGLQTLFAFGGDPGLSALEQSLAAYSFADILAIVIPVAQVVAGGLLVFGLLTPLGAAIAVVVSGFLTGHALSTFDASYWPYALSPTAQLWALTGVVALVITFTGPGRYSADTSRRWATRPLASAWVFALIGLGGAAGLWLAVGGGNPF